MESLLVRNADLLVTMDAGRREIAGGGLFAEDGLITAAGSTSELPSTADTVVDMRGHVIFPGLVNTHHHLYQTLTRALPGAQNAPLFDWLRTLYPTWARMTPDDVILATRTGLTELALTGCTTAFDHHYLWPNDSRVDDQVEAASSVGLRFHVSRGSMSLGQSAGGLPPDSVVENEAHILRDTQRVIEAFHDPARGAMVQVVVAPCSPFSVTTGAMRDAADLARSHGVTLHTHLAETVDEEEFCRGTFGAAPIDYARSVGWLGDDVWFAHAVWMDGRAIEVLADTGTGVAHCPTSNMRLGSGVAPVARYIEAGVRLGLGVDGSASNDGSNLLAEARQAMLLARLAAAPAPGRPQGDLLPARTALELATRGGAAVLGRDDIGSLEAGKMADFAAVRLDRHELAGAMADPVAGLVLCSLGGVDETWVHGRPVVRKREIVTLDHPALIAAHNRAAARVLGG